MTTIDITEQALGTQSATLKIDYLEKARTFENKHFMIMSVKMNSETGHQVILKTEKTKKPIIFFNLNKAPFRIKITHEFAENWKIRQEIKRSQMNNRSPEGLYPLVEQVEKSVAKIYDKEDIEHWGNWQRVFAYEDIYEVAFNRSVRHERKRRKTKRKALTAFDVISSEDVTTLSHELGISEDKLTYAVMEVISKRKNGGMP
jgi:hypothetical protein